ncbi:MAG: hypothetical protein A3F77_11330 [Betaproteobacteria bacterium RIFCSPLOWO2_12_FULL_67_28]|nr:MAG: hypothetical protein A3I65_05520 [Betaproteobacteria bacterium RIFCSPLOWO2_02_FULL_68_150]OGA68248.1 MAG: hypothetical protein A3F77_11330 [Betaproteobacteria bacterium RIFCSPLOWO2_12_FULL_67_28]
MLGIILAAGRGSRMGTLTADRPKALVRLAGKTLLDWQLEALSRAGVTEVTVVTGYLAQRFEGRPVRTLHNPRWQESNMVRSLMCAGGILAMRAAVLSYSDIVYHPDAVNAVIGCQAPIAVAYDRCWESLWRERFGDPLRDAESFLARQGFIADIGRRVDRLAEVQGQYMGLLGIRPQGWEAIAAQLARMPAADVDALDMTALLRTLLQAGQRIAAVPVEGKWCEVDSQADAALYERRLAESASTGRPWAHDWRMAA